MSCLSHGKIINQKFTSVASHKFSKLDSYYKSDMIRKSSMNRPADLLDDCAAQQVSAVLASDRILPANKNSGKIQTRRKSASTQILDRELFVNNSMDKIWSLKKQIASSVQMCLYNKEVSKKEQM